MTYYKIYREPEICSNCGEKENYIKAELIEGVIQTIHCYTCDNRAELIEGKNEPTSA